MISFVWTVDTAFCHEKEDDVVSSCFSVERVQRSALGSLFIIIMLHFNRNFVRSQQESNKANSLVSPLSSTNNIATATISSPNVLNPIEGTANVTYEDHKNSVSSNEGDDKVRFNERLARVIMPLLVYSLTIDFVLTNSHCC